MADIIYTNVPGKLRELLQKIRTMGVPSKANRTWLQSIGFKSSNDFSMLSVLKKIGLMGQTGEPNRVWQEYRGKDHKTVLGRSIQSGYGDLFKTYPDAPARSNEDLEHFFASQTKAGQSAITASVNTFKSLCLLADFDNVDHLEENEPDEEEGEQEQNSYRRGKLPERKRRPTGSVININIQLTLPETTDESVYEKLFAAMSKHLLLGE